MHGVPELVDEMFSDEARFGSTYAVVVVRDGEVVHQRFGGALPHFDRPPTPVVPTTPMLSWSMAKSMLHAIVGMLVDRGMLDPAAPAPVRAWQEPGDARGAITLEHLLTMRDGLAFSEDYVDGETSHVIDMLFGDGQDDVAAYAAARPLAHPPDTVFNYSSGTSNIIARIVGDALGGEAATRAFLHDELFGPLGMDSADPRFDAAGTWIASSYVYATARDFARFGELYLHDGVWAGRRLLPEGWVEHATRIRSRDPAAGTSYGAQWWVQPEAGGFYANGYEGQSTLVIPDAHAVVVRLGRTDATNYPHLYAWRTAMADALR